MVTWFLWGLRIFFPTHQVELWQNPPENGKKLKTFMVSSAFYVLITKYEGSFFFSWKWLPFFIQRWIILLACLTALYLSTILWHRLIQSGNFLVNCKAISFHIWFSPPRQLWQWATGNTCPDKDVFFWDLQTFWDPEAYGLAVICSGRNKSGFWIGKDTQKNKNKNRSLVSVSGLPGYVGMCKFVRVCKFVK